jgi:hypothetical protein
MESRTVLGLPAGLLVALGLTGCATYTSALLRGQSAYEEGEHDRALAIFRALERDTPRLAAGNRARYAYLRGMTDERLGYRADARHWLALASVDEKQAPGSLPAEWVATLDESLTELNVTVYATGVAALSEALPETSEKTVVEDADDASRRSDGGLPSVGNGSEGP